MKTLAVVLAVVAAIEALAFAVLAYFLASMGQSPDLAFTVGVLAFSGAWLAAPGLLARRFWRQQRYGRVFAALTAWSVLTWLLLGLFVSGIYAAAT